MYKRILGDYEFEVGQEAMHFKPELRSERVTIIEALKRIAGGTEYLHWYNVKDSLGNFFYARF